MSRIRGTLLVVGLSWLGVTVFWLLVMYRAPSYGDYRQNSGMQIGGLFVLSPPPDPSREGQGNAHEGAVLAIH